MGFLWCKGSKEEKADFLFDILMGPPPTKKSKDLQKASSMNVFDTEGYDSDHEDPQIEPILVWTSPSLLICFDLLFRIAIDLPIDPTIQQEMKDLPVLFEEDLMRNFFIKRQLKDINSQKFYDFNQFKYKLKYDLLVDDWFIDTIFYGNKSKVNKEEFIRHLNRNNMTWIFNQYSLRAKYKKV